MKLLRVVLALSVSMILLNQRIFALEVIGAVPGNAGDTNPQTFHFDSNNVDFQMTRSDGTAITQADVTLLYGTEIVIYQNGQDYITARGLQVMGADLSGAQMTNASFPSAGYVAIDPATGRFKFAGVRWFEMVRLDNVPAYNSWPGQVDINDQNDAVCEVQEYPSFGTNHSYARHYTTSTGWSTAQVVWNTSDAFSVKMGLDGQGKVQCTMMADTPARLYSRLYTPASGWSAAGLLDAGDPYGNQAPALAVNPSGDAVLGFLEEPGSYYYPYGRHYIANVGWESNMRLDALVNTASVNNAEAAINAQGDGVVVYWMHGYYGIGYAIQGNHFLKAGGWQPQIEIANLEGYDFWYPNVVINDQGDAICAYYGYESSTTNDHIYVSHYQAGVGWQAPQRIYSYVDSGSTSYYKPRLVMDNDGNAFCFFADQINSIQRLLVMQYSPAQGWTGPVFLDSPSGGELMNWRFGYDMDNSGFAVCTFSQKQTPASTYGRIMANWYHPQDGWQGAQLVDKTDASASISPVKLNQKGRGILGFSQDDGSYMRAYARFFENEIPGNNVQLQYAYIPATATPTSVIVPQNAVSISNKKIEPLKGEKASIQVSIAAGGVVNIKVYTLRGILVKTLANEYLAAGSYTYDWAALNDSGDLIASGVYILRVQAPGINETQKVVVIK